MTKTEAKKIIKERNAKDKVVDICFDLWETHKMVMAITVSPFHNVAKLWYYVDDDNFLRILENAMTVM